MRVALENDSETTGLYRIEVKTKLDLFSDGGFAVGVIEMLAKEEKRAYNSVITQST
jgi:hypothetical protein